MLTYLEKFKQLPEDIKTSITTPQIMGEIKKLEQEYGISLASVIMRIMVKDISIVDLAKFFVFENGMDGRQAEKLVAAIKEKILPPVYGYLGIADDRPVPAEVISGRKSDDESLVSWIQKRKQETEAKGSGFFFSTEDEEEVRDLAKKIEVFKKEAPAVQPAPLIDFDSLIEATSREMGIGFSSEDLKKRFFGIMATYLKGIRSKIDTKEALSKEVGKGGMGFTAIYADNILLIAERKKTAASQGAKPAESSSQKQVQDIAAASARDHDYDFRNMPHLARQDETGIEKPAELRAEQKPAAGSIAKPFEEKTLETGSLPRIKKPEEQPKEKPAGIQGQALEKKEANRLEKDDPPPSDIKIQAAKPPVAPIRPIIQSAKPKMEDVKHMPRLVGPLDELSGMDLTAFRRLGKDGKERCGKILEKISFLEGESYAQRLAGVGAWRKSHVNRQYLEIGKKSIGAKQPINDIIKKLQEEGGDSLSQDEFMAVMELNKRLRY